VSKTLLAVDDSATMRKVLEITFSGEDFAVITADSSEAALGKLGEKPDAVVIDTALGNDDGYALASAVRKRAPGSAIVLLSSRYAPYDPIKGKESGADDFIDKPFDTQQIIDKVKKVLLAKEGGVAAPAPSVAPAARPASVPVPVAAAPAPAPVPAAAAAQPARSQTLVFGEGAQPAAKPAASEPPKRASVPAAAGGVMANAVNGHLAGKLSDLGLSTSQADAVLALSREVVERVVWEVVPQLAETLIKEEIARLTKEG
jgi:DNA-binding response OmpR family regulator